MVWVELICKFSYVNDVTYVNKSFFFDFWLHTELKVRSPGGKSCM